MVRLTGFEPTTFGSGGQHSIQLSYSRASSLLIINHPAWNIKRKVRHFFGHLSRGPAWNYNGSML